MSKNMVGGASGNADATFGTEDLLLFADIMTKRAKGIIPHDALARFAQLDLRPFVALMLSKRDRKAWEKFYREEFGMDVDLSDVMVPVDPTDTEDFSWVVVVVPDVDESWVMERCRRHFKVKVESSLVFGDSMVHERLAQGKPYAIRVRASVEPHSELKDNPPSDIITKSLRTMTLLERLLLGFKYYREVGKHLDLGGITLCSGSKFKDRGVSPSVYWNPASDYQELYIGCFAPGHGHVARRVIELPA